MRKASRRTRLLAGAFVIITIAWTVDMLTGAEPAKSAEASQLLAQSGVARIVEPSDRALLERFLFEAQNYGESYEYPADGRNPFAPDATFAQVAAQRAPNGADGGGPVGANGAPASAPAPAPAPFDRRHHLGGVLLGRRSLALIDGRPYCVGDIIDGMTLVDIRRDFILLRGADGEVRLDVPGIAGTRAGPGARTDESSP